MTAGFFLLSQGFRTFVYLVSPSLFLLSFCGFCAKITDEITDEIADGSRTIHADTPAPQNFLFILYLPLDFTLLLAYNKHVDKRGARPKEDTKMLMNAEMIKNIKQTAEYMNLRYDYDYIGVRVQEVPFELGSIDHNSHVWDDGDDTGVELDGICACTLDRLGSNNYFGDHVAIICGNDVEYGEDDGEIIIRDAEVVKVIC